MTKDTESNPVGSMKVANSTIIAELMKFLEDMDFFRIYPTQTALQRYIRDAPSDGDRIRAILRNEYVQQELFYDWRENRQEIADDPIEHYLSIRGTM